MALSLVEGAVDRIRDYILANIATHIAAVNAAHAAPDITAPQSIEVAEIPTLKPMPFYMVLADESRPQIESSSYFQSRHSLTIALVDTDQDPANLRRKLYRHVEAVMRCIIAGNDAGVLGANFFEQTYARYSPIYANNSTYHSDAQIYIDVQMEETY